MRNICYYVLMFVTNMIVGLLLCGVGAIALQMNYRLTNLFGRNNVFERKLGPGSTYFVFQVLAVGLTIFGALMTVSLHDNVLRLIFSPLSSIFSL